MFKPGISGNPHGRPKGSYGGRTQALALIDQLLSKKHNQKELLDDLEAEFHAGPAKFFRNTIVPLLPRTARDAPPPDALDDWLPLNRTLPSAEKPAEQPAETGETAP